MSHPAKQINEISYHIVNGEYDEAIVSLTNTLKRLKLVLSGDAKILITEEMEDENDGDDCMDCASSSLSDSFEYHFFSSPTSSFLKTAISVKEQRIQNSRLTCSNPDATSSSYTRCDTIMDPCISTKGMSSCSSTGPQHQLQVSIFRDPIMVRGNHFHAPLDIQICEELSYVAIYNLALSHHLKSVELEGEGYSTQNLRQIYLYKALSLYEHSHQILTKQTINIGVPVIHSMALVSNLSQIHLSLGDHTKAELCMQYLLSTMMYVIDCGKVDSLGNSIDEFFSMILPLISGDDPAPAA